MRSILLFFVFVGVIFANEVGKFSLVKGEVNILRDGQTLGANSSDLVYNKDVITTKKASKAQIRFKDGTIVTLGKDTSLNIKDYVFNKEQSKVDMGVDDGSFKVITGEIGKVAKNNFKFKANSATIGIRGTIFAGEVGAKQNMIACVQGAIVVSAGDQMKQVSAGKMVEVNNNKLGDIKPIDTKSIETISSIDSNKINENVTSSNNNTTESKVNLNVNTQVGVVSVNASSVSQSNNTSVVELPKKVENDNNKNNTKKDVVSDVKPNLEPPVVNTPSVETPSIPSAPSIDIPSVETPIIPENKPVIPEIKPNSPVVDQVLNDRKNSVFYYSGEYTLDAKSGLLQSSQKKDNNAKAKVDYSKSGSYIVIKQKVDGSVQDRFDFGPNDVRDNGYYLKFENYKGDEMKLINTQNSTTGPFDKLKFESHDTYLNNGLKYKQEMEGQSTTKSDFDNY